MHNRHIQYIPAYFPGLVHAGPVPFLQNPISKIHAPFALNPWFPIPDFPPENLFSQAHFLWQSHTFVQGGHQNPADEKNTSVFFELKGTLRTKSRTGQKLKAENPPEEHFCSFKNRG
jgi:hypothetical protein